MGNENKNIVLSDEELKDVAGGASYVPQSYCEGHVTEKSCRATSVCVWFAGKRYDPVSGWVDGTCVTKGKVRD